MQVLDSKMAVRLSTEEVATLVEKYTDPAYGDLVNFVAFAAAVDPREAPYDPYTLGL